MFLNTKLQSREKPIKVAFIGCGKFVSMFLAQYNQLQKIIIDTIVDINIDNAKKNCLKSGLTAETVNKINFVTSLDEAIDRDVEVFIEATGNPIIGTVHAVKIKLANSTPYEWFYEDCEAENLNHPITFKLKNSVYNNELDDLTAKIFEVCADQKYIDNNGDTYSEFLNKPIKVKILENIEYDWMMEGCEDEYQNYPIKFKLKYS